LQNRRDEVGSGVAYLVPLLTGLADGITLIADSMTTEDWILGVWSWFQYACSGPE
jgi:hypothetical protein